MYDIYAIVNSKTGRAYIGVAPNFEKRRAQHVKMLSEGRHPNGRLQDEWNQLGAAGFRFLLLGETTKQYRHTYEGAYIQAWKYGTYNVVQNRASMNVLPEPVEIDYSRVPAPS